MSLKKTLGMTLAKFCKENKASQITVQHTEDERITHVAGFLNSANYELSDGQTMWYRVGGNLIERVYKKPSFRSKVANKLKRRK